MLSMFKWSNPHVGQPAGLKGGWKIPAISFDDFPIAISFGDFRACGDSQRAFPTKPMKISMKHDSPLLPTINH